MLDKIKWFWKFYKKYPYVLLVLLIVTPIQTAFEVAIPRLMEFTVDFIKTGEIPSNKAAIWLNNIGESFGISPVATYTLTLVLIGAVFSLMYAFVQSHRAWMNMKLEWLFRQDAFNKITCKGPNFFNKFRTGDLVTRMTDDVSEKLSWFACSGIFRLYEAILMVSFTLVMMITIDPMLTLWTVIPLPFLIFIFFRSSSVLDKRYDHLQTRISKLNALMEACFSGIRVVKAYVQEKAQKRNFSNVIADRRSAEINSIKAEIVVDSLYMYIWQFGVIIILLAGGYMVINANLSFGKLVAFIYYIMFLMYPMFDIGQFLVKSRQSAVSVDRLVELEKVPPMVADTGTIPCSGDIKGHMVFTDVEFSFKNVKRNIIDSISFEIKPGQTIALVGKVGSGKSWLVNMIPRLVDPTGGSIYLDGRNLREYRLEDLRRSIGYVPQEPLLFSDTIRNNIVFGRDGITESSINWAIEVSQFKGDVKSFPDKLDTQIGTRGVSISGGQKQRLALARALVGKPNLLILDDCTSALDSRTETALWEQLDEVMPGKTVIMITHRPDMLEKADMIIVLDNGKIIESGTHFELMIQEGHYFKLYKRFQLKHQVEMVS
ncbi:MAG: ABC transporter ATP-binding protein [candidate division Zixibacteria bacterium]|nr:ABC transporter ATP-binding protein [candidate division Zixibacteria bacterium]